MKFLKSIVVAVLGIVAGYFGAEGTEQVYVNYTAFVGSVIMISAGINAVFNLEGIWAEIVSWASGLVWAFVGWWAELGFFSKYDPAFWEVAIIGVSVAFVANKVFEKAKLKKLLKLFGIIPELNKN